MKALEAFKKECKADKEMAEGWSQLWPVATTGLGHWVGKRLMSHIKSVFQFSFHLLKAFGLGLLQLLNASPSHEWKYLRERIQNMRRCFEFKRPQVGSL